MRTVVDDDVKTPFRRPKPFQIGLVRLIELIDFGPRDSQLRLRLNVAPDDAGEGEVRLPRIQRLAAEAPPIATDADLDDFYWPVFVFLKQPMIGISIKTLIDLVFVGKTKSQYDVQRNR
jgi:hypothetical protein